MTRRSWLFALLLLAAVPLFAAKRHAVTPGGGRCLYGTVDDFALVVDLAVDDTHVYWWDDFLQGVKRVPKNGGQQEMLTGSLPLLVYDIAVDDTNVYIASLPDDGTPDPGIGEIGYVPKTGGEYVTLAQVTYPYALAVDGEYVYWVNVGTIDFSHGSILADGSIGRIRKDGTNRAGLAGSLSAPFDVLVDGDNVFFTETGLAKDNRSQGIRRVAKTGGSITHIDDSYAAGEMSATANEIIYYGGEIDGPIGGILHVPKTGGLSSLLVQDPNAAAGPVVRDGFAYYLTVDADDVASMMRVPVTGGTPERLFQPEMSEFTFAVDDCGIYWGTWHGEIVKAPR